MQRAADDGGERLRYEPGDLLVDTHEPGGDRETAVVVRYVQEVAPEAGGERLRFASDHEFEPGTTVAEVNPDEFADDLVVEIAFEPHLDTTVPAWRDLFSDTQDFDSPTFSDLLSRYCREGSFRSVCMRIPRADSCRGRGVALVASAPSGSAPTDQRVLPMKRDMPVRT